MNWSLTLSSDYVEWNRRLLDFCAAHSVDADGRFYLNAREMLSEEPDEARAEENFCTAVATTYKSLVSVSADPIRRLRFESDQAGRPLCAAFLGLSALAAERMTDNAYYVNLCKTLDLPEQADHLPPGFVRESFEDAWRVTLGEWLRSQSLYLQLPLPSRQRFVQLPKMHALLRAGDLSKLPGFFLRCGYRPTNPYSEVQLSSDFNAWVNSAYSNITTTGRAAWQDPTRRPGIVKQIIRVLERWDGSAPEFSRRNAIQRAYVSLHLDLRPERVLFRVRRKPGFPDVFPFAGGRFIAVDEEYYRDLAVLREFGARLRSPYEESVGSCRITFRGASVFAFVSEGAGMGYGQSERLVLHEKCAALFRTLRSDAVLAYLKTITDDSLEPRDLNRALPGWSVVAEFSPKREMSAPVGLDALGVEKKQYPRLLGGLKAGQGQTWLAEAPPVRLEAVGERADQATINGEVLDLRDGRYLELEGRIRDAGSYDVVLGERRFIRVAPGRLNTARESGLALASDEDLEAALAEMATHGRSGGWLLLGSVPGHICALPALPGFTAQWRLGYQDGEARIIALTDTIVAPQPARRFARPQLLWTQAVLRFAGGRLGAATPKVTPSEARRAWQSYACLARRLRGRPSVCGALADD